MDEGTRVYLKINLPDIARPLMGGDVGTVTRGNLGAYGVMFDRYPNVVIVCRRVKSEGITVLDYCTPVTETEESF